MTFLIHSGAIDSTTRSGPLKIGRKIDQIPQDIANKYV